MGYLLGIGIYIGFNFLVLATFFLGGKEGRELDKELEREAKLRKYNFK